MINTPNIEGYFKMDNQQFSGNSQTGPAQAANPYAPAPQQTASAPISLAKSTAPSDNAFDQTIAASSSYTSGTTAAANSYTSAGSYDQVIASASANSAYGQINQITQGTGSYGQTQNSYSQASGSYGQTQNSYSQASGSYGQTQSPYGQNSGAYGQTPNAYSQQPQNPYGHSPYGPVQDPYSQINPYSTPYQGSAYTQPGSPVIPLSKIKEPVYTPEQVKKARTLCITSLLLYVSPYIYYIIMLMFGSAFNVTRFRYSFYGSGMDVFIGISAIVILLTHLAGIVLMIIARASYPKFTFAKVLMWIYIGITIAIAVVVGLTFAFFYYLCSTCSV